MTNAPNMNACSNISNNLNVIPPAIVLVISHNDIPYSGDIIKPDNIPTINNLSPTTNLYLFFPIYFTYIAGFSMQYMY